MYASNFSNRGETRTRKKERERCVLRSALDSRRREKEREMDRLVEN